MEYLQPFEKRRELIKQRVEELTVLILDSPRQRKRVMKIQEIVQKWLDEVALPQINDRQTKGAAKLTEVGESYGPLGNGLLNQAREILQSLQNEEQIVLNQRMREQEWAAQSTQILDFLTKLERSAIEMQKEKRGYLLTGDNVYADAYRRTTADFYTYHGYLSILVANVPLVPESPPPPVLFALKHPLIVGLTTNSERLIQIRRNRLLSLNQAPETDYVDTEAVNAELAFARRMFADNGWPVIDVTRRSIEETAFAIVKLCNERYDAAAEAVETA